MVARIPLILVLVLTLVVGMTKADFVFGPPENLGSPVNSPYIDYGTSISPDGLSHYFTSDRPGGSGGRDLWVAARPTLSDPWGLPINLGPTVNSPAWDSCPNISADGLTLFFESERPGGSGGNDIWFTTRATPDGDWGPPTNLGSTVNTPAWDSCPAISTDGLTLYFTSERAGGSGGADLWVTMRPTVSDSWGTAVNLGSRVNSSAWDGHPGISADNVLLFFHSARSGGSGSYDIWLSTWAGAYEAWEQAVNLGSAVNDSAGDIAPDTSPDHLWLFFGSERPGGFGGMDIWKAPLLPIVDFNGDGTIDAADMCVMVDHWGIDEALCDIGPMPWGDGIVDVEDLKILAEHLFEEVNDPTLVAHWPLDETEGMVVTDSAGDSNGYALGDPVWQADGGKVNGALEFDGIDDFISTTAPLNPADGSFSVFAWLKGGAPGQAIISEPAGVDWLSLDSLTGHVMTELTTSGRDATPLKSQAAITDGNWHRIGFVWDGLYRTLYVDDAAVAEDTHDGLQNSGNGLYIGCGEPVKPGTFFSGLIDDVRIYNRVVKP